MNSGGTATYLNTLIPALNARDIETLLLFGEVASGESEDINIGSSGFIRVKNLRREISPYRDFLAYQEFNEVVQKYRPDIIHSHAFKAGLISRLSRISQAKRVHTFHGHHLYDPEFNSIEIKVMNCVEKKLTKRTNGIIYVGQQVKIELEGLGIGEKVDSISIPPGIDLPKLMAKSEATKTLGIEFADKWKTVVLWMGRFVEVKRPEEYIAVARKFPESLFLMAGDGPLRLELEKSAPVNIRFLGWQPREALLSIADFVVSTSRSEGMPLSLIEAQVVGLPVVAPRVGSVSEILIDEKSGYLVNASLADIEVKVRNLIENKELLLNMSQVAIENSKRKFGADALAQAHHKFYANITQKKKKKKP